MASNNYLHVTWDSLDSPVDVPTRDTLIEGLNSTGLQDSTALSRLPAMSNLSPNSLLSFNLQSANVLNPNITTVEQNGITLKNSGDFFILNGTASADTQFIIEGIVNIYDLELEDYAATLQFFGSGTTTSPFTTQILYDGYDPDRVAMKLESCGSEKYGVVRSKLTAYSKSISRVCFIIPANSTYANYQFRLGLCRSDALVSQNYTPYSGYSGLLNAWLLGYKIPEASEDYCLSLYEYFSQTKQGSESGITWRTRNNLLYLNGTVSELTMLSINIPISDFYIPTDTNDYELYNVAYKDSGTASANISLTTAYSADLQVTEINSSQQLYSAVRHIRPQDEIVVMLSPGTYTNVAIRCSIVAKKKDSSTSALLNEPLLPTSKPVTNLSSKIFYESANYSKLDSLHSVTTTVRNNDDTDTNLTLVLYSKPSILTKAKFTRNLTKSLTEDYTPETKIATKQYVDNNTNAIEERKTGIKMTYTATDGSQRSSTVENVYYTYNANTGLVKYRCLATIAEQMQFAAYGNHYIAKIEFTDFPIVLNASTSTYLCNLCTSDSTFLIGSNIDFELVTDSPVYNVATVSILSSTNDSSSLGSKYIICFEVTGYLET